MKSNIANKVSKIILCFVCFVVFCNPTESFAKSQKHKTVLAKNISGEISVHKIAKNHNMFCHQVKNKTFVMRKNNSEFIFTENSHLFLYNGQKLFLGFAPKKIFGSLNISKIDYQKNILPFISPPKQYPHRVRKIVIDPGHGGSNFGTVSSEFNVKEKDLTFDIAQILAVNLKKCGYQVFLSRTSDAAVELTKRSDIANNVQADLFISIHCNHAENGSASGIETFYVAPNGIPSYNDVTVGNISSKFANNEYDGWNLIFAYCVQTMMMNVDRNVVDRGVKASRFGVLKNLRCPGILLECGFISNKEECKNLSSRTYRVKLANTITHGVLLYDENLRRVMNK